MIGATEQEIVLAVQTVVQMNGGLCAVRGETVLEQLPLPIAGLMSDQPVDVIQRAMVRLIAAAQTLGCPHANPYMAMAFLALPVISDLKLTDRRLVDVREFALCSAFVTPAVPR